MLQPGSMISVYKVEALIGKGGMGEVYKGFDTTLNRPVAIKALNPDLTTDTEFLQRFHHEAQIQASLNHPNIISLYALPEVFGSYYMILEYASGITIRDLIKKTGPIPEKRVLPILTQILEGLALAHRNGIIHRDIKPTNIIVGEEDRVKILDFGIARLIGDKGLTKKGHNVGTLYYMSPEQVHEERDLDGRTDIFSLGVTFFEMLTGRIPYNVETGSDYSIKDEIVKEPIPDPRKYYEFITDNTVQILRSMVAKNKEDRFASCEEVLEALQGERRFHQTHAEDDYSSSVPVSSGSNTKKPNSYLVVSVVLNVLMPFSAIIPLIYAFKCNTAIAKGDLAKAVQYSKIAKIWLWISIGFHVFCVFIYLLSEEFGVF